MSELPLAASSPPTARMHVFEQRIFDASPWGTLPTSVAVFVALVGSFEIAAIITGYPLHNQLSFSPREGAWPAVILSLTIAVSLGMQRYVRLKSFADEAAFERIVAGHETEFAAGQAREQRSLLPATIVGAAVGLAATFFVLPSDVITRHVLVFLWFAVVMSLVGALFARGVAMTRMAAREFTQGVDRFLTINLLRIDELFVIGRASARIALVWLSVAAVICLFFVSGQTPVYAITTIGFSAAMAFYIFFRSLERVHRKIHASKRMELDRIRHEIAEARRDATVDAHAATRLHGLLAYEKRIADVQEWPFDQWTLIRVSAYILIPAVPSIGQFFVKHFMERFAQ